MRHTQDDMMSRLDKIEALLITLVQLKTAKDWYTTAEVAHLIGKSDYTVREYCRKGQIKAEKSPNGRGWLVSHSELERLRNYGPQPEFARVSC